jgi:hypothetical protein
MGISVAYQTTEQISPALQREMIEAANELSRGRSWLGCEGPYLMNENGTLAGSSKPNFLPHADDVASAKSEGLPDGTLNDLLGVLCELSRRFDVTWEISHDHSDGPLGYIRNGICDDEVKTQCDAFSELADELGREGFDLDDL